MKSELLQQKLIAYTAANSGHQDRRPYIGLSGIGDCDRVIYDRYMQGEGASTSARLKFAIANIVHEALIARLGEMGLLVEAASEIVLYDGLVRGHADGDIDGDLLEVKTVEREEYLPDPHKKLPSRLYWQVQAYMHYVPYAFAQVVYLARDTGALRVYGVPANPRIADRIDEKLDYLVDAVRQERRPACTCCRCVEAGFRQGDTNDSPPAAANSLQVICLRCGKIHAGGFCPKAVRDLTSRRARR
jgi:hypothetical protein